MGSRKRKLETFQSEDDSRAKPQQNSLRIIEPDFKKIVPIVAHKFLSSATRKMADRIPQKQEGGANAASSLDNSNDRRVKKPVNRESEWKSVAFRASKLISHVLKDDVGEILNQSASRQSTSSTSRQSAGDGVKNSANDASRQLVAFTIGSMAKKKLMGMAPVMVASTKSNALTALREHYGPGPRSTSRRSKCSKNVQNSSGDLKHNKGQVQIPHARKEAQVSTEIRSHSVHDWSNPKATGMLVADQKSASLSSPAVKVENHQLSGMSRTRRKMEAFTRNGSALLTANVSALQSSNGCALQTSNCYAVQTSNDRTRTSNGGALHAVNLSGLQKSNSDPLLRANVRDLHPFNRRNCGALQPLDGASTSISQCNPGCAVAYPQSYVCSYDCEEDMEVGDCILVLQQIQDCRAEINQTGCLIAKDVESIVTNAEHSKPTQEHSQPTQKSLWLIVDTNVFLHKINTLYETMWGKYNGVESVILVIPWMVIQELDHIKDDKSRHPSRLVIQPRARQAINQINDWLMSKNPHIVCQTAAMSKENFDDVAIETNDDRILQCCVQYKSMYGGHEVALLSFDTNLRNKAMILGIAAYTSEMLLKLSYFVPHRKVGGSLSNHSLFTPPIPQPRTSLPKSHPTTPALAQTPLRPSSSATAPASRPPMQHSSHTLPPHLSALHSSALLHPSPPNSSVFSSFSSNMSQGRPLSPRSLLQHSGTSAHESLMHAGASAHDSQQHTGAYVCPTLPCAVISPLQQFNVSRPPLMQATSGRGTVRAQSVTPEVSMVSTLHSFDASSAQSRERADIALGVENGSCAAEAARCAELYAQLDTCLTDGLSHVVRTEMESIYGDIWLNIICEKPPWNLLQVLNCIKQHMIAVFYTLWKRRNFEEQLKNLMSSVRSWRAENSSRKAFAKILKGSMVLMTEFHPGQRYATVKDSLMNQLNEIKTASADTSRSAVLPQEPRVIRADSTSSQHSSPGCMDVVIPASSAIDNTSCTNQMLSSYSTCAYDALSCALGLVDIEAAQNCFQEVWVNMDSSRCTLAEALSRSVTQLGTEERTVVLSVFCEFCRGVLGLHESYKRLLLSQYSVVEEEASFQDITCRLSAYAQRFNVEKFVPVPWQSMQSLFQEVKKRNILENGFQQLCDEIIQISESFEHVSPAEKETVMSYCGQQHN